MSSRPRRTSAMANPPRRVPPPTQQYYAVSTTTTSPRSAGPSRNPSQSYPLLQAQPQPSSQSGHSHSGHGHSIRRYNDQASYRERDRDRSRDRDDHSSYTHRNDSRIDTTHGVAIGAIGGNYGPYSVRTIFGLYFIVCG